MPEFAEPGWPEPIPPALHPAAPAPLAIADSLTSREWEQLVDIVVRRLERRITDDLDRRGRRATPRTM